MLCEPLCLKNDGKGWKDESVAKGWEGFSTLERAIAYMSDFRNKSNSYIFPKLGWLRKKAELFSDFLGIHSDDFRVDLFWRFQDSLLPTVGPIVSHGDLCCGYSRLDACLLWLSTSVQILPVQLLKSLIGQIIFWESDSQKFPFSSLFWAKQCDFFFEVSFSVSITFSSTSMCKVCWKTKHVLDYFLNNILKDFYAE